MYTAVHSNKKKHSSAILLGFVFSVLLFGILFILGIYMGIFRNSFLMEKLSTSHYSEKSYEAFQERTKNYCEYTGIPFSVVEKTYSKRRFLIQQRTFAQGAVKGKKQLSNQENLQEEVNQELIAYLKEKKIPTSKTIENGLWEVTSKIEEFYREGIQINFLTDLGTYKKEITKRVSILLPCFLLVCVLILLIMLYIFKHKQKAFEYLASAAFSSVAMLMAVLSVLYKTMNYGSYVTQSVYYKELIEQYAKGSRNAFFYSAAIGLVLFILFLIAANLTKKNGDRWEKK